jgi:leader peptidase (prepilin peptidase)/N-methyltransferase
MRHLLHKIVTKKTERLRACLLLALLMEKLLRRDAMGGGDIKLLFLTGLFLGWQKNLLCLLLACVVGILWGLVRAKRGQQGLPWGPGIALAAWCAALFGQNLIDWYLSLL